ncbi:MAG: hypothetical protein GX780_05815 [Campylobacteraceae bacterium]|nr:hypothetical protein [Campylobacteraceae bacterium]
MSNFPSKNSVIKAVLTGIEVAKKNYFFWTNDRLFLSYGPRKIITIHVAQELGKIPEKPEVFIDATVADILRCSLPTRSEYSSYMQENNLKQGAVSITLDERFTHENDNDSISKVIISIKNGVRNAKQEYTKEIERLCKMLYPKNPSMSTLDYAIFAFYADLTEGARKKLATRIPQITKSFDKVVSTFPNLEASFQSLGVNRILEAGEWCAGAYIISPKANPSGR